MMVMAGWLYTMCQGAIKQCSGFHDYTPVVLKYYSKQHVPDRPHHHGEYPDIIHPNILLGYIFIPWLSRRQNCTYRGYRDAFVTWSNLYDALHFHTSSHLCATMELLSNLPTISAYAS